jgi:hypothetical protein
LSTATTVSATVATTSAPPACAAAIRHSTLLRCTTPRVGRKVERASRRRERPAPAESASSAGAPTDRGVVSLPSGALPGPDRHTHAEAVGWAKATPRRCGVEGAGAVEGPGAAAPRPPPVPSRAQDPRRAGAHGRPARRRAGDGGEPAVAGAAPADHHLEADVRIEIDPAADAAAIQWAPGRPPGRCRPARRWGAPRPPTGRWRCCARCGWPAGPPCGRAAGGQ